MQNGVSNLRHCNIAVSQICSDMVKHLFCDVLLGPNGLLILIDLERLDNVRCHGEILENLFVFWSQMKRVPSTVYQNALQKLK